MAQLIILIGRLVDLEWTFVGHIKRTAIGLPPSTHITNLPWPLAMYYAVMSTVRHPLLYSTQLSNL